MNQLFRSVRKQLRDWRDYQAKARSMAMANRKRNNDALFARLGIKRPAASGPSNKKRIILHSIIAFALFAGIAYWLTVFYFAKGGKPFFGAFFLPFDAVIGYLAAVYFLSKK